MRKWIWLACLGLLGITMSALADAKPVSFSFATSGGDTGYDTNGDGIPLNVAFGKTKGSLGHGDISIASEWRIDATVTCPDGALKFSLVTNKVVAVTPDLSQLIAIGKTGWMCIDPTTGYFWGVAEGDYLGGTGHYKGASGTWTSKFDGYQLGSGYAMLNGSVKGTLNR